MDEYTKHWLRDMECAEAMNAWNPIIAWSGGLTRKLFIPAAMLLLVAPVIKRPSVATIAVTIASPILAMFAQWLLWALVLGFMQLVRICPLHKASVHIVYTIAFIIWPIVGGMAFLACLYYLWVK